MLAICISSIECWQYAFHQLNVGNMHFINWMLALCISSTECWQYAFHVVNVAKIAAMKGYASASRVLGIASGKRLPRIDSPPLHKQTNDASTVPSNCVAKCIAMHGVASIRSQPFVAVCEWTSVIEEECYF